MAKRVRLVDIADRLNLTKVSVSKALRDHPDISKETRDLVKKTAAEMGYSPNLLARSLSSQRSNTLGVVVPKIAHTFFASVIDAIQEEATAKGYGIVLAVSNESAELEGRHIQRLLSMRVDGVLVSVSKEEPNLDIYRQVKDMHVPLVFFDRSLDEMDFSSVTVDDREGAFRGVEYLIEKGHRKIVHLADTHEVTIGRERRAGFEAAMARHGLAVPASAVIEGGFDEWHGYHAFADLLRRGDMPDAVFAVSFPVGLGVFGAMREFAPELIGKVEIVTFGEGGANEFFTFPHVCVRQPTGEMGRRALSVLLECIESDGEPPVQRIVLDTEVVNPAQLHRASMESAAVRLD